MKIIYKTIYGEILQTYNVVKITDGELHLKNENYPNVNIKIIKDKFITEDGVRVQYCGYYKYEIINTINCDYINFKVRNHLIKEIAKYEPLNYKESD